MAQPRTIEQGRAQKAYEFAQQGMNETSDYKNKVKSFPMMIKTNGLGAAVAFAKGKSGWSRVYQQIENHLMKNDLFNTYGNITLQKDGLDYYLTHIDSTLYRAITVEVMALFTWLRRFAEGFENQKG